MGRGRWDDLGQENREVEHCKEIGSGVGTSK